MALRFILFPESPGPSQVAYSRLSWELPPLPDSFFTAGATLAAWAAIGAGGMTGILFLRASMVLGGVAQMLAPKARTPRTDNG